jgi:hypothetical protein
MSVKTAFDMDDVQLFDYCQRNELLGNREISSIFELDIPAKRTVRAETSVTADTEIVPCNMHAGMQECHAADTAENLKARSAAERQLADSKFSKTRTRQTVASAPEGSISRNFLSDPPVKTEMGESPPSRQA